LSALANAGHERSVDCGSRFLRKCPLTLPKITYRTPVNTMAQAAWKWRYRLQPF
jgi:hypothetical protein